MSDNSEPRDPGDGIILLLQDDSKRVAEGTHLKEVCKAMGLRAVIQLCAGNRLNLQQTWQFVRIVLPVRYREFVAEWKAQFESDS